MTMGALRDTRHAERRQRPDLTRAHLALGVVAVAVTIVFLWAVWAFLGAILWSLAAAIMFWPLNNRILLRFPRRRHLAAILTLLAAIVAGPREYRV